MILVPTEGEPVVSGKLEGEREPLAEVTYMSSAENLMVSEASAI